MNFTPFLPFASTSLPVNNPAVSQLTTNNNSSGGQSSAQVVAVLNNDDNGVTYLRPVDPRGLSVNLQQHNQIITLPITIHGSKPGEQTQQQTIQIQVVNPSNNNSDKVTPLSLPQFAPVFQLAYNQQTHDEIQLQLLHSDDTEIPSDQTSTTNNSDNNHDNSNDNSSQSAENHNHNERSPGVQDVKPSAAELVQHQEQHAAAAGYPMAVVVPPELLLRTTLGEHLLDPAEDKQDNGNKDKDRNKDGLNAWQATPVSPALAEYLSHFPAAESLQLANLQHFLKFPSDSIKRESFIESSPSSHNGTDPQILLEMNLDDSGNVQFKGKKRRYKRKPPKPKRPRPGQVHIATALDGTLLFCCPECNMAYPDKEMLEQHLIAHKIDRRYICDICGAGLKRKEHLERHKLGHNPERPFVCQVCTKGFKRKEHLNLHAVIHSGEKTEICPECGKGFYRRDHLRKHLKSHIAKRLREELQQQQQQQQLQHQMQHQQQHHLSADQQHLQQAAAVLIAAPQGQQQASEPHDTNSISSLGVQPPANAEPDHRLLNISTSTGQLDMATSGSTSSNLMPLSIQPPPPQVHGERASDDCIQQQQQQLSQPDQQLRLDMHRLHNLVESSSSDENRNVKMESASPIQLETHHPVCSKT